MVAVGARGAVIVSDTGLSDLRSIPSCSSARLSSVTWTPGGGFVAVGDRGTMLRSMTATGPILPHATGLTVLLQDVVIDRSGLGYVVGAGVVLRTADSGRQWTHLQAPSTDVIAAVAAPDASTVWIVGRRGLIFRSTDGGATWHDRRSPTENYLSDVYALDSMTAVVVGASGVAIRTTDGGVSWTFARVDGNPDLNRVAFTDARHGVAVGNDAMAAITTDGGISWTRRDVPIRETARSIVHMTGATSIGSRVVAVGSAGVILSYDFGRVSSARQDTRVQKDQRVRWTDGRLELVGGVGIVRARLVDPLGRMVPMPEIAQGSQLALQDLSLRSGLYFLQLELASHEWITVPIVVTP